MFTHTNTFIEAIRSRSELTFIYDGARRVYWTYILGETKSGEVEVFGWQMRSDKGGPPDFRQFRLRSLTGPVATGLNFERPLQPVDPERRGFVRVLARL